LVATLQAAEPSSPIVIHHDRFQSNLDPAQFAEKPNIHLLTSDHPIVWGDMTLEAARWRVFRWILENLDVDWVMLLSEQDYPIVPLSELQEKLQASGVDAVISARRVDQLVDPSTRYDSEKRYLYQYITVPKSMASALGRRSTNIRVASDPVPPSALPDTAAAEPGLVAKAKAILGRLIKAQPLVRFYQPPKGLGPPKLGVRALRTPFSPAFPCWYNDCWFALSRTAMQHVVDYVDENPRFTRYYRRTWIPLESATATILFNDPNLTIANESLHVIKWTDHASGRPDFFRATDAELLRSSGAIFARKFDIADPEILDRLDRIVLGDVEAVPA
jgi:hypothetical protein